MIKLSKKAEALLPALMAETKDALLAKARSMGVPLSGDFSHEEIARLLADRLQGKQQGAAKAERRRYKDESFYQGEALSSAVYASLVRFARWRPDGMADVTDMVLRPLPTPVPAGDLVRPSTLPDAQWLADVARPVCDRGS